VHPYDILVLGTQPVEIPVVAGVITDEIQAPLGHIAVLTHSRGTPNMASRGASTSPAFTALDGKPAHLVVGSNDFQLVAATQDELARAATAKRKGAPKIRLALDDKGLPALAEIDPDDVGHFGAKTTQLARVRRLGGIRTPRAFGLPFSAYARFMTASGADRMVAALLGDAQLRRDPERLRAALDAVRARMMTAAVPPAISGPLAARIRDVLPGTRRVRLRSSTNAEDLDGFSGAGLYTSAKIDPALAGDLDRGLREVWASVWSYDAWLEREWYGIDHARVAMAILVQESIDDDVVNGVAITGNPFYEGRPAVYINAQARGGSVTGAAGNEIPEQILYYTYETGESIERISDSSRARGTRLVADVEARSFASQLVRIHDAFTGEPVGGTKAVDVEFLIRDNRQIIVVQARPYEMKWTGDRRMPDRYR
jgi:phosphoenolpyruvate synthase/pyruvate phosphate dikinase